MQTVHPHCSFILNANEGYTSEEAIEVLRKLNEIEVTPVLFEQPDHRDDWKGLRDFNIVARDIYGIIIVEDESCRSLNDVQNVMKENLARAININLTIFGALRTFEIAEITRKSGLNLVIDGRVVLFAGHLAADLGCFKYVNLNTSLLLAEDPVVGGYEGL